MILKADFFIIQIGHKVTQLGCERLILFMEGHEYHLFIFISGKLSQKLPMLWMKTTTYKDHSLPFLHLFK